MHISEKHGNPTILVPAQSGCVARRVIVSDDDGPVWRSHVLAAGVDTVRVDVWHGRFVGCSEGWSVLSGGDYVVTIEGAADNTDNGAGEQLQVSDGCVAEQQTLRIAERELFVASFCGPQEEWFTQNAQWHQKGTWIQQDEGITAQDEPAYLFAEGAMHGTLSAEFCLGDSDSTSTFGLIARLYNAFTNIRVFLTYRAGKLHVVLARVFNTLPDPTSHDIVAEADVVLPDESSSQLSSRPTHCVRWQFNGQRSVVWINDIKALDVTDGFMGGVTVVGLFSEPGSVCWRGMSMTTSQAVPNYEIECADYSAVIRPGNIQELRLSRSAAPQQNIFWESGLQFGHIGGSEIKFTQDARLQRTYDGDVFTQVQWQGPMPKFVDRSDDVRGWAHGIATFYPERIVLEDHVLARTRRSVGPDFDMMSRVLAGPARIALAGERSFGDWTLPDDGSMASIPLEGCSNTFPVCIAFPLALGGERWWLKAVLACRHPIESDPAAAIFAWRCAFGLTASHDFRVAPTVPGIEYSFAIIVEWQAGGSCESVESDLLNLRDDWCQPVAVEAMVGSAIVYETEHDQPAEARSFSGCFDGSCGLYRLRGEDGRLRVALDPQGITRRSLSFCVEDMEVGCVDCMLDGRILEAATGYRRQSLDDRTQVITIPQVIDRPVVMDIVPKR